MANTGPSIYTAYGSKGKRGYLDGLYSTLSVDRASFLPHWMELSQFLAPRRTRFTVTDKNKGDRRNQKIINGAGGLAKRTCGSGMHAGLTSPARPWFRLGTPDPDLAQFGAVKQWLHTVTQRMATIFGTTNLYNALPTIYGDMAGFGTAAMALLSDVPEFMRAYPFALGSYCLGLDARGLVTTFVREYELSVLQLVETFGGEGGTPLVIGQEIHWENFSALVKKLWDAGQENAPVQLLWTVCPNRDYDPTKPFARYARWASCHVERTGEGAEDGRKILRESGFKTFPIFAPRWETTDGDTYGTDCPGMTALGDIKQLQTMERKKGVAIEKGVDPPLVGPTALQNKTTSLLPAAITYVDTREGMQGLKAIHEIALNLEHLIRDEDRVEYRISRAFFEDLFLMLAQSDPSRGAQPVTAREIEERHEEKLLALGPVLERTNDELLNPLIDRTYQLMEEEGLIPDPPPELDGVRLKVEYISILAQAQKQAGIVAQDRLLGTLGPLLEAFPEVRRKVRIFQIVDNYAEMLGIDPRAIVPNDEADAAVQADAQAQQAVVASQVAKDAATAAKTASDTSLTNDSALTRITDALRP